MKYRILIIDDDNLVAVSLRKALARLNYDVEVCLEGSEALSAIKRFDPEIILLDIYLTSHNGIDLLRNFRKEGIQTPVIMITGYADVNLAVKAIKTGANDFLLKPIDLEQLQIILGRASEKLELKSEVEKLHSLLQEDQLTREFFGKSKKMVKILDFVDKIAPSPDTTILIDGESGTGKEMIAKYIHQHSPRQKNAFIQINCAAIPKELAESEFFGHEKGAFTGASQKTKLGKFELADGGTILLDEIAELSLDLQVKLLRVLQEKKFYRVGGEKEISVDVRVLAATNRSLEEEVKKGNFREDLFYRINVANVKMPALRQRKNDIPYIALSIMTDFAQKFSKNIKGISDDAVEVLKEYPWKGNIRELRNILERAILLMDDQDELKAEHLGISLPSASSSAEILRGDDFLLRIPPEGVKIDVVLKTLIQETLKITRGNQVQAAKVLGLSRSKLRYRMEQLGIHLTRTFD